VREIIAELYLPKPHFLPPSFFPLAASLVVQLSIFNCIPRNAEKGETKIQEREKGRRNTSPVKARLRTKKSSTLVSSPAGFAQSRPIFFPF